MATLTSLAARYDPNSPYYDPYAAAQSAPNVGGSILTAQDTGVDDPAPPVRGTVQQAQDLTDRNRITATTQSYDEAGGVAGRVNSLIGADSALMQTARRQAAQAGQARGIGASSLTTQAGEQAVINTATPIATSDAQMYAQQRLANQSAQNSASTTNAQLGVTAGIQGLSLAQQAQQFDVTSGIQQQQANTAATQVANQNAQFGVTTTQQAEQFQANLTLQNRNLDTQISQFAASLGMSEKDLNLRRDTLTAQQQQQLDALNLQRTQLQQQQQQFTSTQSQQQSQFAAQQQQQLVMQNADAALRTSLSELDSQWRTEVNASSNMANAWGTMMGNINAIQNNGALDPATKQQLIANTTAGFASFANFWKTTTNVNVDDLLAYNVSNTGAAAAAPPPAPPAPPPEPFNWSDGGS